MNSAATTTNEVDRILNPSRAMTLEAWQLEEYRLRRDLTAAQFVSRMASGHPAGATHVGVKKHKKNAAWINKEMNEWMDVYSREMSLDPTSARCAAMTQIAEALKHKANAQKINANERTLAV